MFSAKIRVEDRLIIDVEDDSNNLGASWFLRSSDGTTVVATKVPGVKSAQHSYVLVLAEGVLEGAWELTKSTPNEVKSCYLLWASPHIVEPTSQEVLNFISWVGQEEAKKLTTLDGESIDYNMIETSIEQAASELDYLLGNVADKARAVYDKNRPHLLRVIARYRLDRICPRDHVKIDYLSLLKTLKELGSVSTSNQFGMVSIGVTSDSSCGCNYHVT